MHSTTNVAATPRFVCGWETVAARLDSSLLPTVQSAAGGSGHLEEHLADSTREPQPQPSNAPRKPGPTPPSAPRCPECRVVRLGCVGRGGALRGAP